MLVAHPEGGLLKLLAWCWIYEEGQTEDAERARMTEFLNVPIPSISIWERPALAMACHEIPSTDRRYTGNLRKNRDASKDEPSERSPKREKIRNNITHCVRHKNLIGIQLNFIFLCL